MNFPVKTPPDTLDELQREGHVPDHSEQQVRDVWASGRNRYNSDLVSGFTIAPTAAVSLGGRIHGEAAHCRLDLERRVELGHQASSVFRSSTLESSAPTVTRSRTATHLASRMPSSSVVQGGNRDWQQNLHRNQVLGSVSYFKDGWFGNHHLKVGGETFRTTLTEIWRQGYPGDVLHVLRNGNPSEVYLFQTPSMSENGLWTYAAYASDSWRLNGRLTLSPGLRFDRYRVFFPEQTHPPGQFNPTLQTIPRRGQRDRLEPSRAPDWRDLRCGGRRQDAPETQLRAVLLRSGSRPWIQREPQLERVVAALLVVRPE